MNKPNVPPIQMVKKKVELPKEEKPKFNIADLKNIYEFDTELPGSGDYVRFKPFTTGQIKKILAFEGESNPIIVSEVINTLLQEVILNPQDITVHDMFLKDREYLLMEIRNKTKGPKWETQWICEKCKSQNLLNIDLGKLPVKRLEKELINYELDVLPNLTINMRFLTVADELTAVAYVDKDLSETQKTAELVILMAAFSIDSIVVNGKLIDDMSLEDRKYFIEELPTTVYNAITDWVQENEYGTDFNIKTKCHSCDHMLEMDATPNNFFF